MEGNNSEPTNEMRPRRTACTPRRYESTGELGAGAGHGVSSTTTPRTRGSSSGPTLSRTVVALGNAEDIYIPTAKSSSQELEVLEIQQQQCSLPSPARETVASPLSGTSSIGDDLDSPGIPDDDDARTPLSKGHMPTAAAMRAALQTASLLPGFNVEEDIVEVRAGGGTNEARRAASPTVMETGKAAAESEGDKTARKHHLQGSINRAMRKPYLEWSTQLLQKVCTYRGIGRMSSTKERDVLVSSLVNNDHAKKLCSGNEPYRGDLEQLMKDLSKKKYSPPKKTIPAGCLYAFRAARSAVGTAKLSSSYEYEGVTYSKEELLAALDAPGVSTGAGDSSWDSSSPPGASPGSVASDGENGTSGANDECVVEDVGRKTRHCLMRVIGIMVEDDVRPLVMESRLSMTRTELDGGESGASRSVWKEITTRYKDRQHRVARISDDAFVESCDPNIIDQPQVTQQKLYEMWRDVKSKWAPQHHHYRGESGTHQPWEAFCKNDRDIFLMGVSVKKYPELEHVIDAEMPEGTGKEDDGLGDGIAASGAEPDAVKRKGAKRRGQVIRTEVRNANKKLVVAKRQKEVTEKADDAMARAVSKLTPVLEGLKPTKSDARVEAEKAESKSMKLQLSKDLTETYMDLTSKLAVEVGKGDGGDQWLIGIFRKKVASIRAEMEKDAEAGL